MKRMCLVGLCLAAMLAGMDCPGTNGGEPRQVTLKFAAQVGQDPVSCGRMFDGLGTTGASAEVLDLRFYVSNIRLITEEGAEVPLTLDQDDRWQVENVALLDFEDATGGCGDAGTSSVNVAVTGSAPAGDYHGVVFEIGVPFDLNHDNPAAAPAPLNVSAMFWTWAVGHKFIRIDLETDGGVPWTMHLGSTMCESSGPTAPPVSQCARPNRPIIRFSEFDPDDDVIVLDLQALFASSDLTQDTANSSAGCQSFPEDVNECTGAFNRLGLDFNTGACVGDCGSQTAFRVESAVARGQTAFTTSRLTTLGEMLSCSSCHGADGSGGIGPDIRASTAEHVREHPFGNGPHPIKFTSLTRVEANDIAAYLASICRADPACEPGSVEHEHP